MTRRKWFLLIVLALAVFAYFKLFYKTYSRSAVAKSADSIVLLDVKRITNTLIWSAITTPGQWKIGKLFSRKKKQTGWKAALEIPDYIMLFHMKGQPLKEWYTVMEIKDMDAYKEALVSYDFKLLDTDRYIQPGTNLQIYRKGEKLLIANVHPDHEKDFLQAANELFVQEAYASDEMIHKAMDAHSHLAVQINANGILENDGLITGNFDKQKISIEGEFTPKAEYVSKEITLGHNSTSLFSFGFAQPTDAAYALLDTAAKRKISTALNFNIDSFFISSNNSYHFDLTGMRSRIDSAITYTYDDDFNKIENKVVNKVTEPAFIFTAAGDSAETIYNYFQQKGILETTDAGELFTPMPFVKSYVQHDQPKQLSIRAANYSDTKNDVQEKGLFFLQILFGNITPEMWKYFPDGIRNGLANIEHLTMRSNRQGRHVIFSCTVQKKKNDIALIKL